MSDARTDGSSFSRTGHDETPKASIIVVNWNTRELLLQCLRSIRECTPDVSIQIVVVDNASTDRSADAVAAQYPDVTLVRSTENLGFARGNNLGFDSAVGDYLVLLNSDTIVLSGAIQRLVEYLDQHPDVGAAGGMQLNAKGEFSPSGNWFPNMWTDLSVVVGLHRYRWWFLKRRHSLARLWFQTETGDVDWLSGSFVAVRRDVINEVGPLPAEFFMYGEDVEWGWRMKEAGWRRVYVHGAPIIHLENRSAEQLFGEERAKKMLDGFYTFARRHRNGIGWRISWLALACYWISMAAKARLSKGRETRSTARALCSYARRHLDQALGRVPPIGR
jgi:GT2 family glycosyltransferase